MNKVVLTLGLEIGALGCHPLGVSQMGASLAHEQARIEEKILRVQDLLGEHGTKALQSAGEQMGIESDSLPTQTVDLEMMHPLAKDVPITLRAETLDELLIRTYPKGWVHNEVASITQVKEPLLTGDEYGPLLKGVQIIANLDRALDQAKARVIFQGDSVYATPDIIVNGILPHELGHANDWVSDEEMSMKDRIDLLLAVTERLGSEDRYHSPKVEGIEFEEDEEKELYLKAEEYWAEICEQYFRDPDRLHPKDFEIVDARVKAVDPHFNLRKANKIRLRMIGSLEKNGTKL